MEELTKRCKPYLEALQRAPQRVKRFLDELLHPRARLEDEPSPWNAARRDTTYRNNEGRDNR